MKTWTRARLLVGVSLGLSMPGVAHSQLLYNEKLDAQAKAAMTEYQTMRDAHLKMLTDRQAKVAELAERMDAAVTAAVRAERDREVVRILGKPLAAGEDPAVERRSALRTLLEDRIRQLSGLTPDQLTPGGTVEGKLIRIAGISTTGLLEEAYSPTNRGFGEADAARVMGGFHKYFDPPIVAGSTNQGQGQAPRGRRAKDRPAKPPIASGDGRDDADEPAKDAKPAFTYAKFCEQSLVPDLLGKTEEEQDTALESFQQSFATDPILSRVPEGERVTVGFTLAEEICPHFKAAAAQKAFLQSLKGNGKLLALKGLAGIGISPAEAAGGGAQPAIDLGRSIHDLGAALEVAQAETKANQAELRRLKKEQEALQKAMKEGSVADVARAAEAIVAIVGKPPAAPAAAPAALTGATAQGAANAPANAAEPACGGTVTLACARQTAEAYGLASFDKARESALFEITTLLADPQARAAAEKESCGRPSGAVAPEDMARATRVCLTASAMELLGVADRASHISAGRPGELAALGVRIADAQMRVGTAQARAAALTRRIENLASQRASLVNELNILLQAHAKLRQPRSDYRLALLDFGRSIDNGRLPYERANDQLTLISLNEFASREEQVVKGRYSLADGLLSTITSSTSAGLKPAEIAGFLSAIGISTVGIGEISR